MTYRRRYLSGQSATTVMIEEKAVTSDKIADKAVDTPQLADDAVTTEKILDGEVRTEDIGAQAVQTSDIKDLAVTGSKIADNTIPLSKLSFTPSTRPLTPGVDTPEIQDGKVTLAKLAPNSVNASKVVDGSIGAAELAGDAVETVKIKNDAVTAPKIAPGAVGNIEIAADAVRGTEIQAGAVSTDELSADAVETVKIKDANVTEPKLELDILLERLYLRELFYEDFVGAVIDDAWRKNGDAGGSAVMSSASECIITTDNDINDFFRLDWALKHGVSLDSGAGRCIIRVNPAALTNEVIFVGVFADTNNFVGFRLDTAVSGNWYAVSKESGVETATDTGVAAVLAYRKLEVFYPAIGADIEFRINDVLKATITTNKFTGTGHPCLKIQTLANATKSMKVDLALAAWNRIGI